MELSYAYTEMERRFLAMDDQEIATRAASGAKYILGTDLPFKVKFSVMIYCAKAGTTQNGELNAYEKSLIRYIFERNWKGTPEELFEYIKGPAEDGYLRKLCPFLLLG